MSSGIDVYLSLFLSLTCKVTVGVGKALYKYNYYYHFEDKHIVSDKVVNQWCAGFDNPDNPDNKLHYL